MHNTYSAPGVASATLTLMLVVSVAAHAQRYPDFPPARVGAIVYVTPLVTWQHAIMDVVDSNATVRASTQSQLHWPSRLKPEQDCRTNGAKPGAESPLSASLSVLSQRPLDVSVERNGSNASEVGSLVTSSGDTAVVAAHYLRVWRRDQRDWRVVYVCTSPIRDP